MQLNLVIDLSTIVAAPFVGSFLGVAIRRIPNGRPIVLARSACESCGRTLEFRDLIPLVSWLALRGKCRSCGSSLSAFYPAVELAALGIAIWSLAVLPGWIAWAGIGLGWTLLVLACIDQRTMLLPDVLTLPLGVSGLVIAWLIDPTLLPDHVIGAVAGYVAFTALAWLYRRFRGYDGLGSGDAKLVGALGAWLGWQGLPTLVLYGALSGLLYAIASSVPKRQLALADRLPFGPHLCLGGWLVWLYGPLALG